MRYANGDTVDRAFQREVLERTIAAAREAGAGGLVIFDLDSTLLDNRTRQAAILREFGAQRSLDALTRSMPEHFTSWSMADAMRHAGLDEAGIAAHEREAKDHWRERFFTSAYCALDVPNPGAVEFVVDVLSAGAQVAYVTGRDESMREGTLACFARERMPLPDDARVRLLCKPSVDVTDDSWKSRALPLVEALGDVVAAFDNEPAHVNTYAARWPGALVVHLATDHSGRRIPLAPGVPSVADFVRSI